MTARREVSRQEFLKITGRAAAGAAVGSTLLLATASGQCGGGRETALITDFGARGNGRHDDTEAILRAIDEMFEVGGGIVKVPATDAFYKTTRAIDLRSAVDHPVRIVGEGEKSFIKNTTSSGGHQFAPVFRPGLLVAGSGQYSGAAQDFHSIAPAEAGADRLRPKSGRYKPGDMLFIRGEQYQHGPRQRRPLYPQINIVEGVDDNGYIKLADPLADDHPDSEIAVYPYGVSYGSLENLRFEHPVGNEGFGAISGGGAYRMEFRDLFMSSGVSVMSCNGIARCLLDNVSGNVAKKGLEIAYYSHSTTIRNCTIEGLRGQKSASMALYVTEAAHRMVMEDCSLDLRGKTPDGLGKIFGVAGFLGATRHNVMRRCTIRSDRYSKGIIISGSGEKPSFSNRIEDCYVSADGAQSAIMVSSGGSKAGHHVVTHNEADGDGARASITLGANSSDCEATHNVAPHGVKNLGKSNTVRGNAEQDGAGVGP